MKNLIGQFGTSFINQYRNVFTHLCYNIAIPFMISSSLAYDYIYLEYTSVQCVTGSQQHQNQSQVNITQGNDTALVRDDTALVRG